MNILNAKKIFFVGIKGVGMTGLAQILKSRGIEVRGSDTKEEFFTDAVLQRAGIEYGEQFQKENITRDIDAVIYSAAYTQNHIELEAARKLHIPTVSYQQALGQLSGEMQTIAITGSHGKTTTTALCGVLHAVCGEDPTVLVGSEVLEFGGNARIGNSDMLIVEADEYKKKVLDLKYHTLVVTNVDFDHPDVYKDANEYKALFQEAVNNIAPTGRLVRSQDNLEAASLVVSDNIEVWETSLLNESAKLYAKNIQEDDGKIKAEIYLEGLHVLSVQTSLLGEFNIANILAALATLSRTQIENYRTQLERAIEKFQGTRRRFEPIGYSKKGALLIDDYAHHPTEIEATLKAARLRYPNKVLWCVFHAHTYSRTKALLAQFAKAFQNADHVIVPDIYSSARETSKEIHAKDLVKEIQRFHSSVQYMPGFETIAEFLQQQADDDDLVIAMGAGDVWRVVQQMKS